MYLGGPVVTTVLLGAVQASGFLAMIGASAVGIALLLRRNKA